MKHGQIRSQVNSRTVHQLSAAQYKSRPLRRLIGSLGVFINFYFIKISSKKVKVTKINKNEKVKIKVNFN